MITIDGLEAIIAALMENTSLPREKIIESVIPENNRKVLVSLIDDLLSKKYAPGPRGTGSLQQTMVDCIIAYLQQKV